MEPKQGLNLPIVTAGVGLLLVVISTSIWKQTGGQHLIALGPSLLGAPLMGLGAASLSTGGTQRKTITAAMAMSGMGFVTSLGGVLALAWAVTGGRVDEPLVAWGQTGAAAVFLSHAALCVRWLTDNPAPADDPSPVQVPEFPEG